MLCPLRCHHRLSRVELRRWVAPFIFYDVKMAPEPVTLTWLPHRRTAADKTKDGSCIRDFIHVYDIAEIHLKILEKIDKLNVSKILNCGYDKGISVLDVAKEFIKCSSKKVTILKTNRRKQDIVRIIASNKKLKNFIKWRPKYNSLNAIVKSCLNWEKKTIIL